MPGVHTHSIDHVHSAAVTLSGLTAWQALFTHGGLRREQKVLIHGGAGGVGTFAVQLAHLRGAHVITTSSGANLDFLRGGGVMLSVAKFIPESELREHNTRGPFFIVEPSRDQLEEMAELIDAGSMKSFVASVFPLAPRTRGVRSGRPGATREARSCSRCGTSQPNSKGRSFDTRFRHRLALSSRYVVVTNMH